MSRRECQELVDTFRKERGAHADHWSIGLCLSVRSIKALEASLTEIVARPEVPPQEQIAELKRDVERVKDATIAVALERALKCCREAEEVALAAHQFDPTPVELTYAEVIVKETLSICYGLISRAIKQSEENAR